LSTQGRGFRRPASLSSLSSVYRVEHGRSSAPSRPIPAAATSPTPTRFRTTTALASGSSFAPSSRARETGPSPRRPRGRGRSPAGLIRADNPPGAEPGNPVVGAIRVTGSYGRQTPNSPTRPTPADLLHTSHPLRRRSARLPTFTRPHHHQPPAPPSPRPDRSPAPPLVHFAHPAQPTPVGTRMRGGRGRLRGVSPFPCLKRRGGGSVVRTLVPSFIPPGWRCRKIGADPRFRHQTVPWPDPQSKSGDERLA
jgi:hypothetical protein